MFEQHAFLSSPSVSNLAEPFSLLFSSFYCLHSTELRIFQNAHAYLCQHRCLTATSSWFRTRCGRSQWNSRSWLEHDRQSPANEQTPIPVIRKMLENTYPLHKRTQALVRSRSMRKIKKYYEKSESAIKRTRSVQIIPVCFSRISSYRFIDLRSVD